MLASDLLADGLELMLIGMGTVFIFLSLMVLVTSAMSAVIQRFFPEALPPPQHSTDASGITPAKLAAITAAIHLHRKSP